MKEETTTTKTYVSDIIENDYVEYWRAGNVIYLETQPDSGKTTFILERLLPFAAEQGKRILLLVSRSILQEQVEEEFKEILACAALRDNALPYEATLAALTIETYQTFCLQIIGGKKIAAFDFIVADECHYFLSDSVFNRGIPLLYNFIMAQENAIRIFMSGTIENFKRFSMGDLPNYKTSECITVKTDAEGNKLTFRYDGPRLFYSYNMSRNYDFLNTYYYQKTEEIIKHIITRNEKTLFFVSSKEKGEKIQKAFETSNIKSVFITAENKKDNPETIKNLVKFCKFQEKVLIATSVLDVGVNIKDEEVVNVVIEAYDRETFLQMLGRVRQTDGSQGFNLFIRQWAVSDFNLQIADLGKKVDFFQKISGLYAETFTSTAEAILINENEKELFQHCTYFDGAYRVNRLSRYQENILYANLMDMVRELRKDPDYSLKRQLLWIGKEDEFCIENFISGDIKTIRVSEASEMLKKLSKDYQEEVTFKEIQTFCEAAKPIIRSVDGKFVRKSSSLSINKFNHFTKIYDVPLKIHAIKYNRPQKYKVVCDDNSTCHGREASQ